MRAQTKNKRMEAMSRLVATAMDRAILKAIETAIRARVPRKQIAAKHEMSLRTLVSRIADTPALARAQAAVHTADARQIAARDALGVMMLRGGREHDDIARELKLSRVGFRKWLAQSEERQAADREGAPKRIPGRTSTKAAREYARAVATQALDDGADRAEARRAAGICKSTLQGWITSDVSMRNADNNSRKMRHQKAQGRPRDLEKLQRIIAMFDAGLTQVQIADEEETTAQAISAFVGRHVEAKAAHKRSAKKRDARVSRSAVRPTEH